MKQYNVLVTGTSSYGVGEGILKTVNSSKYRDRIKLIGASNSDLVAYRHILEKFYVLPNAADENYLTSLKSVLDNENIDILIPGSEAEAEVLSQNKDIFGKVDIWVNISSIVETFNNKLLSHKFYQSNNFHTPKIFNNYEENNVHKYPLIMKPTKGKSSENIYIINNEIQLKAVEALYKAYDIEYILQEYIKSGEEYTVSLINLDENYQEIFILKRVLNKGATQYVTFEDNECIKRIAIELHRLIKNELILNIQIIKQGDKYHIIEINPRFSGSSPMRALMGFNEFDIIFSYKYLNTRLKYDIKEQSSIIRGYSEFTHQ